MYRPKHKRLAILTILLLGSSLAPAFGFSQKALAQSCHELTGADVEACEGQIETCAQVRSCEEGVYRNYGLIGSDKSGPCTDPNVDKSNCGIIAYLVDFINILSGIVGIVIVGIITFRGVQYTFSRDNPQIVAQARDGIRDAVFALVYFLLIFAFLQWLVPGGIF